MADRDELFKDFKTEDRKKMDKDDVEIKIRFKKSWLRWIERAVFIIIILVLAVLVYYSPFCDVKCEKSLDEITSAPVVTEAEDTVGEEVAENGVEEESEVEEEPEQELSGKAVLEIGDITLDDEKKKVESIIVKIDNQYKIFTPLLYVYWYDKESVEAIKTNPNGGRINFTVLIPLGQVTQKKLDDELQNHYLRTDDPDEEFFKIELYDIKKPTEVLDTKTKSITT